MGFKKAILILFTVIAAAPFYGCGEAEKEVPVIPLSIWGNEYNTELLTEIVNEFNSEHSSEVKLDCTISVQSESSCRSIVLSSPENAADIFAFADDQLSELADAGALLENTYDPDRIIAEVGGPDSAAGSLITRNGKVYAYPQTAGNGYFLYYNKKYFSEKDIERLDSILRISEENEKKFTMDFTAGWYLYSFFRGAGLELSATPDGLSNICNWNAQDTLFTGADVAESLLKISDSNGFVSLNDEGFVKAVQDGTVIAGVNGAWNSDVVSKAWGDDFAAAMLPSYTIKNEQKQMYSFCGYKLLGINAHTREPDWCRKLASYITNEENQLKLYRITGECPASVKAASSEEVKNSPVVNAISAQSEFSTIQNVSEAFWDASNRFGIIISGGNKDGKNIQELLDNMVNGITAIQSGE